MQFFKMHIGISKFCLNWSHIAVESVDLCRFLSVVRQYADFKICVNPEKKTLTTDFIGVSDQKIYTKSDQSASDLPRCDPNPIKCHNMWHFYVTNFSHHHHIWILLMQFPEIKIVSPSIKPGFYFSLHLMHTIQCIETTTTTTKMAKAKPKPI